jgi:nucleoside-diphosphate-sugar epimerase
MKAIITGATGGLGHNLVEFLVSKGWDILACGRNKTIGKQLAVKFNSFDLSDETETLNYFENADVVVHCAALSSPWGSYETFYKANVKATQNVLKAMEKYNIPKLIHISTPSIYFEYKDQLNIKEDFVPKKFVNNYAKTKYEAEQIVLNSNIHSTIIRPRGIFGKYDSVLVPRLEAIAKKGFIPLVKGKDILVDVTYVENVVYAIYLAATKDIATKMIFNITNDQPIRLKNLFEKLMASLDQNVKFKYVSYRLLMLIANSLELLSKLGLSEEPKVTKYGIGLISFSQTLDISKAKEMLGYKALYSIEEGLTRYGKWRQDEFLLYSCF